MKRIIILFSLIITALLTGCTTTVTQVADISADMISIYYGYDDYAFFTTDKDADTAIIEELVNSYKGLSLEPIDKKIDVTTMYHLTFLKGGEVVASVSVDQSGVFWLNGKPDTYKQTGGDFSYARISELYNKGKEANSAG